MDEARRLEWMTRAARCAECEAPATCVGLYEDPSGEGEPAFACDDCCGHACEDGVCYQLPPRPPPKPCANCGHAEYHCPASGCNHHEPEGWCDCEEYAASA